MLLMPAANERTFLSWCSMATTMGGVSSAMVGLSVSGSGTSEGRLISRKTVDLVSAVYIPVAILMICYALFTFEWRSKFMNKKQVNFVTAMCAAAQSCFAATSEPCCVCLVRHCFASSMHSQPGALVWLAKIPLA